MLINGLPGEEEWFRFPYKLIIKFNLKLTLLFNYCFTIHKGDRDKGRLHCGTL